MHFKKMELQLRFAVHPFSGRFMRATVMPL